MISALKLSVFLSYFIFSDEILQAVCKSHLSLRNNGPAVVGANVTFFSLLTSYSESSFIYIFDDGVQEREEFTSTSFNVSLQRTFPTELYVEGRYCMNVTVEVNEIIYNKKIAENQTCFELKRFLIGKVLVFQGNKTSSEDVEEVSVGENFTAVIDIYDPNNYLKNAIIDYSWSFDMDNYLTLNNSITYDFIDVGQKRIIAKPTATFPNSDSISGFFSKAVTAKVPVNNVNVSGNPFLHHGDFLMLNISCNGT